MAAKPHKPIPFDQVLAALLDPEKTFPPAFLRSFSDLELRHRIELMKIWNQIDPQRRIHLLEDLEELEDMDYTVSFNEVARVALKDPEPDVRIIGIRLLWGVTSEGLAATFIRLMQSDPVDGVRAQAAAGLGYFIYMGELEEINPELLHTCEDALIAAYHRGKSVLIRRRALESLGYSSRQEVPAMIRKAYSISEDDWLNSSLVAMGRSANSRWGKYVLASLENQKVSVQVDAIHAAGELSLEQAREPLLQWLEDGVEDEEVFLEIVWALSSIGGEGVRPALEKILEESDDDEDADIIEDALDNLLMTEGLADLNMFDFDVEDADDIETKSTKSKSGKHGSQ